MLALDETLALKRVEVLSHRDAGDAQPVGQRCHLDSLLCGQYLEYCSITL